VQPERRLILDFDDQGGGDDDSARQHDDEDRRAVAGIDEGVVEPARFAIRPQVEEARIELALSATRAAAGNAAECALGEGGRRLICHELYFVKEKGAVLPTAPLYHVRPAISARRAPRIPRRGTRRRCR